MDFQLKIIYRSFVIDNFTNFHVSNDDHQILEFMVNKDVFKDPFINEDEH